MRLALMLPMLLLLAAHAPFVGRHHAVPAFWHFPSHDGMSRRDFGRALGHFPSDGHGRQGETGRADRPFNLGELAVATARKSFDGGIAAPHRLDLIPVGHHGAQVHVGVIQGHHPGIRIGIPF